MDTFARLILFLLLNLLSVLISQGYTDVKCENCWYESHENAWEMEEYHFPDYEAAFWTCCYQCWNQELNMRPFGSDAPASSSFSLFRSTPRSLQEADDEINPNSERGLDNEHSASDDVPIHSQQSHIPFDRLPPSPVNDPRGERIRDERRAFGNYTYPPGEKRNGLTGTAPTYFEDPDRQCPYEYSRLFYARLPGGDPNTRPTISARSEQSTSYGPRQTSQIIPFSTAQPNVRGTRIAYHSSWY